MCGASVADAGVEIVDVGGAGFAEGHPMHLEAGVFQQAFEDAERTGIGGSYGRAADEVAGDGNSIIHASRLTRQTGGGPALCGTISISLCWSQGGRVSRGGGGASGSAPNRLVLREPFRQYISTKPHRPRPDDGNGQRQVGVGIGKPFGELIVEAGHREERHHPPAALVAVMQPLDRDREIDPHQQRRAEQLDQEPGQVGPCQATDRRRDRPA